MPDIRHQHQIYLLDSLEADTSAQVAMLQKLMPDEPSTYLPENTNIIRKIGWFDSLFAYGKKGRLNSSLRDRLNKCADLRRYMETKRGPNLTLVDMMSDPELEDIWIDLRAAKRAAPPPAARPLQPLIEEPNTSVRLFNISGIAAIGVNLADAAIHRDVSKAVGVVGGVIALDAIMLTVLRFSQGVKVPFAATIAGVSPLSVAGTIVGAVYAGMDTIQAIKEGNKGRAVASGLETSLYAIASFAGSSALFGSWFPPVGWSAAAVAGVTGGLAVCLTGARTLRDNWDTAAGWFSSNRSNDSSAVHGQPTLPVLSGMTARQLAVA